MVWFRDVSGREAIYGEIFVVKAGKHDALHDFAYTGVEGDEVEVIGNLWIGIEEISARGGEVPGR